MTRMSGLVLVAAVLALTGCGGGESEPEAAPAEVAAESAKTDDVLTEASCRHFRNVMGDIDVLNDAELREKLKEVHDQAQYSEDPGVPQASRAMLAAITGDDPDALVSAAGQFSDACAEAGV